MINAHKVDVVALIFACIIFQITLPIGLQVEGDITIIVYHARNTISGVIAQGRPSGTQNCFPMLCFGMYLNILTNFRH